MKPPQQPRPFTGRHMAIIMIAFFGVIIAVNLVMARFAVSTFGGTVVDNSYVASQRFNQWLDEAERQKQLGWSITSSLDEGRHVEIRALQGHAALTGLSASGSANHPLGRAPSVTLDFVEAQAGLFRSRQPLPQGRWQIHLTLARDGNESRFIEVVQ
ncbi:MAG: FixH family protein [Sphingobium sp.]